MLELALHIITKEGRKIRLPRAPEPTKPTDLLVALRQSAEAGGGRPPAEKRKPASSRTAAGKAAKRRKAA
jgi:DNA end-binding protein Ku